MSYVLVRTDHGKREFVAPAGSEKSYTTDLTEARIFTTRDEAENDRCKGNETIVPVDSLLNGRR